MQDWPIARWRDELQPWLPGVDVQVVDEITSTNTELMNHARLDHGRSRVLVALQQSAGRGRMGRQWITQPGDALTFSLGMTLDVRNWSGLSLAVGVALASSLHPDLRIKWPNDVWWHRRKLAGVLIETAQAGDQRYVVVGVGINIRAPQTQGLSTPAAWLQEALEGIDAPQALDRVLLPLARALRRFETEGFVPFAPAYARLDALRGVTVRLSDGLQGVAKGVDDSGALLVHTGAGVQAVSSSEVSVRPS